jgi:putative ABC transport system ATP-binding protein
MATPVRIEGVTKVYPLGRSQVIALKNINLHIDAGEFTVIAGPSGCGKSTLLNLIGCMDTPTSGEVKVGGHSIAKLNDRQLTHLRLETLGFIFQSFNLIPVLSVRQNIEFPLLIKGGLSTRERAKRVDSLIDEVGLTGQANQRAPELSGGQRQRVAIARALVSSPAIVLADEPTANLDSANGERIIELMKSISELRKTTFIFSTHDPQVMHHARRIIRLKDGEIVS